MEKFNHLDETGRAVMVDISEKKSTIRFASARSLVTFPQLIVDQLKADGMQTHKGSVLQIAIIAGIMAAKKTGELIPLCHPIGLENCDIKIHFNEHNELEIYCTASVNAKTGVEIEAMMGASIAALTVYDMCKSMSHDIIIKEIKLLQKTGGKNDFKRS